MASSTWKPVTGHIHKGTAVCSLPTRQFCLSFFQFLLKHFCCEAVVRGSWFHVSTGCVYSEQARLQADTNRKRWHTNTCSCLSFAQSRLCQNATRTAQPLCFGSDVRFKFKILRFWYHSQNVLTLEKKNSKALLHLYFAKHAVRAGI